MRKLRRVSAVATDAASDELEDSEYVNSRDVTLGVVQIWVHASHRRRGVAAAMLEAARRSFAYGHVVERHDMAFCQPTADGLALARRFTGQSRVLVY